MAREINYTRYRPADTWQELGLVGDTLLFTDDEIVTQQAIGYTKYLCEQNCPMDIAVVYSMLNQGEGATPTAKELLNDHTRLAYYFESGKVADGWYRPPLEKAPYSCSSTVDFPMVSYVTNSYSNLHRSPPIDVSKLEGLITRMIENKDSSALGCLIDAYHWENWSNKRWWESSSIYDEFLMTDKKDNADFKALMSNGTGNQVNAAKVLELIQQYIPFTMKPNSDWCTRSDDGEGWCEKHAPDMSGFTRHWVFHEGLPTLNVNSPISYYEKNKVQMNKEQCGNTLLFSEHKRRLIKDVNDKDVVRLMNKSLTRMAKRGTVRQVSSGRGRMFEWKAWGWLQNIRTRILASNAKQRKIDDVVNGWKYTKGNTTMSYGMEINDHDWKPVEDVSTWQVKVIIPYAHDSWNGLQMRTDETALPHIFFTKQDAFDYMHQLTEAIILPTTGVSQKRTVNKDFDVSIPSITYKVVTTTHTLSVDGVATIEEYDTPQEMYKQMQMGNKEAYTAIKNKLRVSPNRITMMVKE